MSNVALGGPDQRTFVPYERNVSALEMPQLETAALIANINFALDVGAKPEAVLAEVKEVANYLAAKQHHSVTQGRTYFTDPYRLVDILSRTFIVMSAKHQKFTSEEVANAIIARAEQHLGLSPISKLEEANR